MFRPRLVDKSLTFYKTSLGRVTANTIVRKMKFYAVGNCDLRPRPSWWLQQWLRLERWAGSPNVQGRDCCCMQPTVVAEVVIRLEIESNCCVRQIIITFNLLLPTRPSVHMCRAVCARRRVWIFVKHILRRRPCWVYPRVLYYYNFTSYFSGVSSWVWTPCLLQTEDEIGPDKLAKVYTTRSLNLTLSASSTGR